MTLEQLVEALKTVMNNFLTKKKDDPGYNLEATEAKELLTIINGYPWS
jgi:hypothetical protein